jgi:uncharacterized protein
MITDRRGLLSRLSMFALAKVPKTTAVSSRSLFERILGALNTIDAVDTHEHIIAEADRVSQPVDFFTLAGHYAINDVISAGLAPEWSDVKPTAEESSIRERWRQFEPFWKVARFTGYGQALRIAIRDIYGFEEISLSTLPRINEAIRTNNKPGLYRRILKERARIHLAVLDDYWNAVPIRPDPEFFVLARKFDRFVTPANRDDVQALEKITGVSITSLRGLRQALEKNFQQSVSAGMVTVKTTLAYQRDLLFHEVEEADAARNFEQMIQAQQPPPKGFHTRTVRPFRVMEDFMFHEVVRLAEAHHVPVQIHTGLHAGNGNFIANSNPTLLTNLFFLYPRVSFDLFHISYPYQGELSVLAKLFPNVYADFCWAYIISPTVSRRALHEFLETIPVNKIFGFGGDYRYPELSYAHAKLARQNIAQVLAEKTESDFCSEAEAVEIGRMLLRDNASALFLTKS